MVKWPWKPPGQRWSTVYVTVASTGVGEADAVGLGEGDGGGADGERAAGALADGDADGELVGVVATRWCAGARALSVPRGLPLGRALALVLPGSAAEQLTMPQPFATRGPSQLFIRMIAPVASAAAAAPASSAPYHR